MTREDINDIINAICPNDEDYEKPCISPKYLRQELEQLALDQRQWNGEPTTKNDLVTLTFSKGTLKYSCKDYVVYKKDWLRSHYGAEIDIMFGDSQYKKPTTKNNLGVECINRAEVIKQCQEWRDCEFVKMTNPYHYLEKRLNNLPSVTPQNQAYPLCEDCHTKMDEVRRAYDNAMNQEPILDKLRAEIEIEADTSNRLHGISEVGLRKALKIIDKYKAESED